MLQVMVFAVHFELAYAVGSKDYPKMHNDSWLQTLLKQSWRTPM